MAETAMLKKPFILTKPLEAYKGSYFSEVFVWKAGTPPVAVDISGYHFEAMFRDSYGATDIIKTLTDGDGLILTEAEGKVEMVLQTTDTDLFNVTLTASKSASDIPYKDFPFDIDAIPPDNAKRFQFVKGVLRVYGEVTRSG